LNLIPTHSHRMGDHMGGKPNRPTYKHGMWSINARLPREASLEDQLDDLLNLLEPKLTEIKSFAEHSTVDFSCSVMDVVGFQLSPTILTRLNRFAVPFGVSIYCVE
jgi:hypothetical protein